MCASVFDYKKVSNVVDKCADRNTHKPRKFSWKKHIAKLVSFLSSNNCFGRRTLLLLRRDLTECSKFIKRLLLAELVDYGSKCTSRLEQLCNNAKFSDITLKVNGHKFYAHKLLLANASDVFE